MCNPRSLRIDYLNSCHINVKNTCFGVTSVKVAHLKGWSHNISNDLVKGNDAFCQPKETLLTEVLAENKF